MQRNVRWHHQPTLCASELSSKCDCNHILHHLPNPHISVCRNTPQATILSQNVPRSSKTIRLNVKCPGFPTPRRPKLSSASQRGKRRSKSRECRLLTPRRPVSLAEYKKGLPPHIHLGLHTLFFIYKMSDALPEMQYRFLGRTGLKVSVISLGSWLTYGGHVGNGEWSHLSCIEYH